MSKAEERAFEYQMATCPNVIGGVGLLSEDEFKKLNTNPHFKAGYEQAEKDIVGLTWKDMKLIHEISEDYWEPKWCDDKAKEKAGYEKVLRRFNKQRNK